MAAIDKWALLDAMRWDPHKAQLQMAENQSRHKVVAAGRRAGKSDWGGNELAAEALATEAMLPWLHETGNQRIFWIVGPEYTDAEKEFRVCYNALSRLEVPFDKPGTYNDAHGGNLQISLWNGKFVLTGKSSKYPLSLTGEGLCGVVMAEAAKMKPSIWTKFIRPMLADFDGWSIHSSTPEGKNHFYDRYQSGQDPHDPEWSSWRMPSWVNPYVYKLPTRSDDVKRLIDLLSHGKMGRNAFEIARRYRLKIDPEIISLANDQTTDYFMQEIAADFTEFVGRVFKEWDEDIHVGDFEFQRNWMTFAAVDYGFTNPNVWLLIQVSPWGQVVVLDEIWEPGLTTADFGRMIIDRGLRPDNLIGFYPDPEDPGSSTELSDILKVQHFGNTGGLRKHRIDGIRKGLRPMLPHLPEGHPERVPKLMVNRRCPKTRFEMGAYKYPEQRQDGLNAVEEPLPKDNHAPEALGRFWKGYFGSPDQVAAKTRQSKAAPGRNRAGDGTRQTRAKAGSRR